MFILRERDRERERERERDYEQGRSREREGERESQAGSALSARSLMWSLISWTVRSWLEPKLRVGHLTDWLTQASSESYPVPPYWQVSLYSGPIGHYWRPKQVYLLFQAMVSSEGPLCYHMGLHPAVEPRNSNYEPGFQRGVSRKRGDS